MSMAASSSYNDHDSRSLQVLLEAFGSRFTLDDIASAYCQASQNVDAAGEILYSISANMPQSDQIQINQETSSQTYGYVPNEVRRQEESKAKIWKPRRGSTSIGTVSSVIGKEYVRTKPLSNTPKEATKPMKIDSKEIPENELWSYEMPESNMESLSRAPPNVEEFIVKMLKEGFQASQDVIDQTLSVCGYDVTKITEKFLDLSYTQKYADVGISNEIMSKVNLQRNGSTSSNHMELQENSQRNTFPSQSFDEARPGSQEGCKDSTGLEKEVLESLFSGTKGFEEETKVTRRTGVRRSRAAGRIVFKPLEEDLFQEIVVAVNKSSVTSKDDEDDEQEYKLHRQAVHDYWHKMKQCYGAAVEAFSKGETERARILVEKGYICRQKAREADDKSIAKIIDVKKEGGSTYKEDEVVTVNANEHETKEAVRLLKLQLKNFSGISSIKYLRVKLGENKQDSKFRRRRIAIIKLLDGDSITWTDEDSGLVMMIRVDEIDPKKLSFVKK